jgi:hypothetical protein
MEVLLSRFEQCGYISFSATHGKFNRKLRSTDVSRNFREFTKFPSSIRCPRTGMTRKDNGLKLKFQHRASKSC